MKRPLPIFRFALASLLLVLSAAARATAPDELLRSVTNEMFDRLQSQQELFTREPQRLFELVEEVLVPHVDTQVMSRMVLGVNWRRATPEQRARFAEEFKNLLIRFYVSALLNNPDQLHRLIQQGEKMITFLPGSEPQDRRTRVRAEVHPPEGPTVPVSFSLYQNDDQWLVYDVNVDGVSIVINYRNSFASQISRNGLPALIDQLARRNEELWQKTAAKGR